MTTDVELFLLQSENKSKFQEIEALEHDYLADKSRTEGVAIRKTLFFGQLAAAGATLLFAVTLFANAENIPSIRRLAAICAGWSFVAIIFGFFTVASFGGHLMHSSTFHRAQVATKTSQI